MEAPAPHLRGQRMKFDDFERELTGGHHIGHLPVCVVAIEGWTFRRCRCGFSLALTLSGAIWWLRTTKDSVEIKSFKLLLRALNSNCWAHPRLELLKNAVVSSRFLLGRCKPFTGAPVKSVRFRSNVCAPTLTKAPSMANALPAGVSPTLSLM